MFPSQTIQTIDLEEGIYFHCKFKSATKSAQTFYANFANSCEYICYLNAKNPCKFRANGRIALETVHRSRHHKYILRHDFESLKIIFQQISKADYTSTLNNRSLFISSNSNTFSCASRFKLFETELMFFGG